MNRTQPICLILLNCRFFIRDSAKQSPLYHISGESSVVFVSVHMQSNNWLIIHVDVT